eukprot:gene1222-116_t
MVGTDGQLGGIGWKFVGIPPNRWKIFVKTLTGKTITLEVEAQDTTAQTPAEQQRCAPDASTLSRGDGMGCGSTPNYSGVAKLACNYLDINIIEYRVMSAVRPLAVITAGIWEGAGKDPPAEPCSPGGSGVIFINVEKKGWDPPAGDGEYAGRDPPAEPCSPGGSGVIFINEEKKGWDPPAGDGEYAGRDPLAEPCSPGGSGGIVDEVCDDTWGKGKTKHVSFATPLYNEGLRDDALPSRSRAPRGEDGGPRHAPRRALTTLRRIGRRWWLSHRDAQSETRALSVPVSVTGSGGGAWAWLSVQEINALLHILFGNTAVAVAVRGLRAEEEVRELLRELCVRGRLSMAEHPTGAYLIECADAGAAIAAVRLLGRAERNGGRVRAALWPEQGETVEYAYGGAEPREAVVTVAGQMLLEGSVMLRFADGGAERSVRAGDVAPRRARTRARSRSPPPCAVLERGEGWMRIAFRAPAVGDAAQSLLGLRMHGGTMQILGAASGSAAERLLPMGELRGMVVSHIGGRAIGCVEAARAALLP